MNALRLVPSLAAASLVAVAMSAQDVRPSNNTNPPARGAPTTLQPPPANPAAQPGTSATQPQGGPVIPPVATPPADPVGGPVTPLNAPPPGSVRPADAAAPRAPTAPPAVDASTTLDAGGNPVAVSGASIDALAAAGVEAALSAPQTIEALRRSEGSEQTRLLNQVRLRLDATSRALTELRASARSLGRPLTGSNFDQLAAEITAREDVLRETLRNASISASEEDWVRVRHELATQYHAYADSVLRARQLLVPDL